MKLGFAEIDLGKKGAIVVGLPEGAQLAGNAAALDKATGGALARANRALLRLRRRKRSPRAAPLPAPDRDD